MAVNRKPSTENRKPKTKFGRIGVLMGGPSSEREISLKSGNAVYEKLNQLGIDTVAIDITTDSVRENIKLIESHKINCAFIALHGRFGEDGQIQEILETLKLPYTGSGMLASRLAMDKIASRKIFEVYGLAVPRYKVIDRPFSGANLHLHNNIPLPVVIKPATQGSSIGLSIVDKKEGLSNALNLAFKFDDRVLIEEYIRGREITVGILDDKALPAVEIAPKNKFFDYEAKYRPGMTDYIVPADLEGKVAKKAQAAALLAHKLLGCFGSCRVDIILNKAAVPFVLEVNSIPGLTETSLLPKAAKVAGIDFAGLCIKLIELAYEKNRSRPAV